MEPGKIFTPFVRGCALAHCSDHLCAQLFRYTFVGGLAFIVDFSTLYILTSILHMHYLASASIGFCMGVLVNYLLSICWVFSNRKISNKKLELFIFALVGIGSLFLNDLIMWYLTGIIGLFYLYSKIFSTIVVYLFNFFVRKLLLF